MLDLKYQEYLRNIKCDRSCCDNVINFKFGKQMKSVFDSSDRGKSVPEKCLHIGLILWPRYSLLAVSGLLEALRYAAKAQDKLAFKISLIS